MDVDTLAHQNPFALWVGSDWYNLGREVRWLSKPSHDTQLKLILCALHCQTSLQSPYICPCLLEVTYVCHPEWLWGSSLSLKLRSYGLLGTLTNSSLHPMCFQNLTL